jgi:hypothetical protein
MTQTANATSQPPTVTDTDDVAAVNNVVAALDDVEEIDEPPARFSWFELVHRAGAIAAILESNAGDDPDGVVEEFAAQCSSKMDGYYAVISAMKQRIGLLKMEEKRIKDHRVSIDKEIDGLQFRALQFLKAHATLPMEKPGEIKTDFVGARINLTDVVSVVDADAIPAEYICSTTKTTTRPDRAAIKFALSAGKTVAGAELETRESIVFTKPRKK